MYVPVPYEIAIVRKETFNNWYRLRTYYVAQLLVSTPIQIVLSCSFATIVYWMTDQPTDDWRRPVRFTAVFVLLMVAAESLGLAIGALVSGPVNGIFVGAMIGTFKILLSGFLAMPSQMSRAVRAMMNLSTLSYTLEACTLSLYDNQRGDIACPDGVMYCHYV